MMISFLDGGMNRRVGPFPWEMDANPLKGKYTPQLFNEKLDLFNEKLDLFNEKLDQILGWFLQE